MRLEASNEEYIFIYTHSLFLYLWSFRPSDATLMKKNLNSPGISVIDTPNPVPFCGKVWRTKISNEQEKSRLDTMSAKRVILANGSRLLREMLHLTLEKADQIEVVQEISDWEGLPSALERFDPAWVIVTQPYGAPPRSPIDSCLAEYPAVRFIFLSPSQNSIKMKWQTFHEEEYSDLSLKEFIHILQRDLQPT